MESYKDTSRWNTDPLILQGRRYPSKWTLEDPEVERSRRKAELEAMKERGTLLGSVKAGMMRIEEPIANAMTGLGEKVAEGYSYLASALHGAEGHQRKEE